MIRHAFFALVGLGVAVVILDTSLRAGPAIEERFFPFRVNNEILRPMRYPDRACFAWSSDKLRAPRSIDLDVRLDRLDASGKVTREFFPDLYREDTGDPWEADPPDALPRVPLGHHEFPYCVQMPKAVQPADGVRVTFTPWFEGWRDLWRLPVKLPPIEYPPIAPGAGERPPP